MLTEQDWVEMAERIDCPAPLPEDPVSALLAEMLVPAPYTVPEKKAEKKAAGTRRVSGARPHQTPYQKMTRRTPPMKGRRGRGRLPQLSGPKGPRRWPRGPEKVSGARPW